jgi:23S rRNA pseudouridine2605 synthase
MEEDISAEDRAIRQAERRAAARGAQAPDEETRDEDRATRLGKLIAQRGVASRRKAEELILGGKVTVNGELETSPGRSVDPDVDHVKVEGRILPPEPKKVYFLMFKPRGVITGRDDPHGRPSVVDMLDAMRLRVEPVGRLDFNTEGALLLTNDGDLLHKLTHPSAEVPQRFAAKVYRTPDARDLQAIGRGVDLGEEGRTKPAKARVVDTTDTENAWVEVTVTDSQHRSVSRMLAALGHPGSKLRRESFATLSIRGMERGEVRPLTPEEVRRVLDIGQGAKPTKAGKAKRGRGFAKPKIKTSRRIGHGRPAKG